MTDMNNGPASKAFATYLKGWQKAAGSKPTEAMLATVLPFSRNGAGLQALAAAMRLRPEGMTRGQMMIACGNPQMNHSSGLIKAGWFAGKVSKNDVHHTVYSMTLTPKGQAKLDRLTAAVAGETADTAAPAKRKAKAKAKAKAVVSPAPVEAVTDTAGTAAPQVAAGEVVTGEGDPATPQA